MKTIDLKEVKTLSGYLTGKKQPAPRRSTFAEKKRQVLIDIEANRLKENILRIAKDLIR